jgi:hypothetical protein
MRLLYLTKELERIQYTKKEYKTLMRKREIRKIVLEILEEAELIETGIGEKDGL